MNRVSVIILCVLFSTVCLADDAHKKQLADKFPGNIFVEETLPKIISNASNFAYDENSVASYNTSIPLNYRSPQVDFKNEAMVSGLLSKSRVSTSGGDALRIEINTIVFINPVLKSSERWPLNLTISDSIYQSQWTVGEAVGLLEKHYGLSPTPAKLLDPVRTQTFALHGNTVRELAVQVAKRLLPGRNWIYFASITNTVNPDGTLQGSGKIPWSMY